MKYNSLNDKCISVYDMLNLNVQQIQSLASLECT